MLTAKIQHDPDRTAVVVLAGQFDLATVAVAQEAFQQVYASDDSARMIVVDMTDLTFMDSSGLAVLLVAVKQGWSVRLRRPSTLVQRVIAATGLSQILPIEP